MSEQKLQKKILDWLTANGYWVVKVSVANKNGVPDILACSPLGVFVAIEVKFGSNKPSPLQVYNIDEIKKRNGIALVAWSLEQVTEALRFQQTNTLT